MIRFTSSAFDWKPVLWGGGLSVACVCLLVLIALDWRILSELRSKRAMQMDALSRLQAENRYLESMSQRLREKTLDHDLLDERVRAVLGLLGKGETRIILDDTRVQ